MPSACSGVTRATIGPRWATTWIRPWDSSCRSGSRTSVRLTPVIPHRSRSGRRSPALNRPAAIALRMLSVTLWRSGGALVERLVGRIRVLRIEDAVALRLRRHPELHALLLHLLHRGAHEAVVAGQRLLLEHGHLGSDRVLQVGRDLGPGVLIDQHRPAVDR